MTERQTEGIIKATGKNLPSKKPPSYGHICKRINRLNINININIKKDNTEDDKEEEEEDYIIIAIDGTGIKATNKEVS